MQIAQRKVEMFNPDLNSPLNRTIFVILGLLLVGFGIAGLQHIGFGYHNWWGGIVFGPFAIAFGVLFIAAMLKLGSLARKQDSSSHSPSNRTRRLKKGPR